MRQPCRSRHRPGLWALLVVALAAVGPPARADPPKPALKLDLYGDSLPPGAVVRLGTVRLRNTWAGVFLPDSKRLATCGHGQVHLFDIATGKEEAGFPKKGEKWASIAVSPRGNLLAALDCETKRVVVWELPTGKEYRRLKMLEVERYFDAYGLVFSSDGKVLMAANRRVVCSWELESGKRIRQFKYTHQKRSSDTFLCCAANQRIPLITTARRPISRCLFSTFSPGGKYLAVAQSENASAVWDVGAGKLLHRLDFFGGLFDGGCAAFSGDGKILVIGSGRGVSLWDVATGKQLRRLTTELECITDVAISPDRKQVVAAGFDGFLSFKQKYALYLWDLEAKSGTPRILRTPGVCWVQYSPDGKTLAGGYYGESVCLIDRKSGKEIAARNAHRGGVTSVAYSPNGKRLATASYDRTVRVWEAATGRPLLTLAGHTNWVGVVAFSPRGRWLVSGDGDGAAILWDASTGAKKRTLKHQHWLTAVSFSPDGRSLATNVWPVQVWDLATGKVKARFGDPEGSYSAPVFSPDWKCLAEYRPGNCFDDYRGGSVRLRERATGRVVRKFAVHGEKCPLTFSPDGRTLAAVTKDKLFLWEVATWRERAAFPVQLVGQPSSLVFSPDGTLLAFCDREAPAGRQVRVWDLAARKELSAVAPGAERVTAIAFSPDGNRLATASEDTTVLIWDLGRRRGR